MKWNGNKPLNTMATSTWVKGAIGMHRWPITKFALSASANKGIAGGRLHHAQNATRDSKYGRVGTGAYAVTVKRGQ